MKGTECRIGCGWASDARSVVRRAHVGLFDELVFGVVIGIHRACLRPQRWGLMCNLSVNRFGIPGCLCIRKCLLLKHLRIAWFFSKCNFNSFRPISHEAIVEFIKDREWQIEHNLFLDKFDVPAQISIKDEDGTDLFFARNKYEILDNYPQV